MVKLSWPRLKLCPRGISPQDEDSMKKTLQSISTTPSQEISHIPLSQKFSEAMRTCGNLRSITEARKVHARLIALGFNSVFLQNHLLNMYLNCGFPEDARRVFGGISSPNVFTWNTMITGLSNDGRLSEARRMFDEMPERDSISWNSMMSGYFRNGRFEETINAFVSMVQNSNCKPNVFTFSCAMKACGALRSLKLGLQLHGFVKKFDFGRDSHVVNSLLDMYIKCGAMDLAVQLFDRMVNPSPFCWNSLILGYSKSSGVERALEVFNKMPERDVVSWNTMISILSRHGHGIETLHMIIEMHTRGFELNSVAYASVLSACASISNLEWGRHLHAQIIRSQPIIDVFVGSALVDMYAKCGHLEAAKRTFDCLPDRNAVSWTAIIAGFAQSGFVAEALGLFNQMRAVPVALDQFTLATVIGACCSKMDMCLGSQLHSCSLKIGYDSSVPVTNALVSMYAKCGSVQSADSLFQSMSTRDIISWTSMISAYSHIGNISKAHEFFDKMTTRNVVTWNSMLAAYIQLGHGEEGLKVYTLMLREDTVRPDWVTFATLLSACADSAALRLGKQVIAQTAKVGLLSDIAVANGIIMMYSKCGKIEEAREVFYSIFDKDLVSWNSMITSYAQNGQGRKAIETFESMLFKGVNPDHISYIAVLSGCSHSGLVEEGKFYFDSMTKINNICPSSEHFACMVDLLGRAGLLEEAKNMIDNMPIQPGAEVWGALLGACRIHGNAELAECAVKHLFELDPKDSGSYVLLANIYTDAGKSDDAAVVRKLMKERGIRKNPGCSWIEVKNRIHVFTVDDANHPQIDDILKMLDELIKKIEVVGYVNKTKSRYQSHHSEKLAVAFGLISLPAWMSIHVMKNLRVCIDCHTVIKLISLVTARELVVRDANRFHHFREGSCSCGDYW